MDVEERKAQLAAVEALKALERLCKGDKPTERPKIVAVDMDGTILNTKSGCEELGEPIPGVAKKLKRLKTLGWVIVIWTVRAETPEIIEHLKKHNIPFDYFNKHPWQPKDSSPKILADCYLDDRAFQFTGNIKDFDQIPVITPWWKKNT